MSGLKSRAASGILDALKQFGRKAEPVALAELPGIDLDARRGHAIIRTGMVCLCLFVLWSSQAEIDQVTRAQGEVIPGQRTQVVQPLESGVLSHLHVASGDVVKAGSPLARLDDIRARAAVDDSAAKVAALQIRIARLRAEVYEQDLSFPPEFAADFPEFVQNQSELFRRRKEALDDSIAALRNLRDALQAEYDMLAPLIKRGDASQSDVLRINRELAQNKADITARYNAYFQEAQAELAQAQEQLIEEQQRLKDRAEVLARKTLYAPTGGIIKNINVTTLGGVVSSGEVLLELVPTQEQPVFEARVQPADIAFVKPGMAAIVKIDAYDFSIFGGMLGKVTHVSEGTLLEDTPQGKRPYYRVVVTLEDPEFDHEMASKIAIRPGMTGLVEIKAMKRTILSYFLNPISKTISTAFRDL